MMQSGTFINFDKIRFTLKVNYNVITRRKKQKRKATWIIFNFKGNSLDGSLSNSKLRRS